MKVQTDNVLACALREFFADHLPRLRGMSPHTLHSYRDSLKLLLRFVAARQGRDVAMLELDDIGPQEVIAFLQYLEDERHNIPATRNVRLAGIHSFFRFLAGCHPDKLDLAQRILGIPFKRTPMPAVEYFEFGELQTVLAAMQCWRQCSTPARGSRRFSIFVPVIFSSTNHSTRGSLAKDEKNGSVLCGRRRRNC
jgi:integrase/recombinase XerD